MTDRWTYADGKVFDGNGILLAHVVYDPKTNFQRNCRMIAAAPEMLEALEGIIQLIESYVSDLKYTWEYRAVCAAIKKARGEE